MITWYLIKNLFYKADFFSQLIIFFILSLSILVLFFIVYVLLLLWIKNKSIEQILQYYRSEKKDAVVLENKLFSNGELLFLLKKSDISNTAYEVQCIFFFSKEISIKVFFGIMAATGPLLGLLGTIWGIMDVFGSLHNSSSIDIAVIAPGISEALLTTLLGLFLAIPALVSFHILGAVLKNIFYKLELIRDFNCSNNIVNGGEYV